MWINPNHPDPPLPAAPPQGKGVSVRVRELSDLADVLGRAAAEFDRN